MVSGFLEVRPFHLYQSQGHLSMSMSNIKSYFSESGFSISQTHLVPIAMTDGLL